MVLFYDEVLRPWGITSMDSCGCNAKLAEICARLPNFENRDIGYYPFAPYL